MSDGIPNPPNARRRHVARRRWTDDRIWRELYCAILSRYEGTPKHAAMFADEAYTEYRERFPAREPELLDDEPEATEGVRPQ